MVDDSLLPSPRSDLPPWAGSHWMLLQALDLAGIGLEEQIQLLKARGLTAERAFRLALALPPLSPRGHLERVSRAGRLLNQEPSRFWPVVESLRVYWGLHPWSILGEPLRKDLSRSWRAELGGPWDEDGLAFLGTLNRWKHLPPRICARRLTLSRFPHLRRLPDGWIVGDLVLKDCPSLEGSLADLAVLGSTSIEGCPRFQLDRFPEASAP